ncbi:MAG: glycoside hydrolase family 43 protein [Bacteroidia bacterium]|nr:glycoside hydrolase family 43 protein [Bacteroidia bacterium]
MNALQNPILRGFNPDPSIVRVGNDYYIATSTFEWFPGVQIHHSNNLSDWELIGHPLDSTTLLDMKGVPDSCGVWAPCLTHDGERFHLVYSIIKSFDGVWKDTPNYLTTSKDITGPWNDPVFLGSYGFDGSMFHDDDGRKWFLSMLVDHRKGLFFGGIVMQEYDLVEKRLVGPVHHIFKGTSLGITEGPHLYKIYGYYYLLTAEGGTDYGHAVTIARSENITGSYEMHPENPILHHGFQTDHVLQRTGHGDLVWDAEGACFMVFLAGRPLKKNRRCTLGRETCIEKITWHNGWPYLSNRSKVARAVVTELPESVSNRKDEFLNFSKDALSIHYQSLRIPISKDWLWHDHKSGVLRIKGRESLSSTFEQSLIARRVQHFEIDYTARMKFQPTSFQNMMGLVCYYNTGHYYYLHVYGDEDEVSRWLNVICCDNFDTSELLASPLKISSEEIGLRILWKYDQLTFLVEGETGGWQDLGIMADASILSDDYVRDGGKQYRAAFTGSFVGVACQDLTGMGQSGAVLSLEYKEL